MVIFVTDEGRFWNHENPILERFSDCVVVVCLNGHAVTDKYTCVVSPYQSLGLGMLGKSVLTNKLQTLASIRKQLRDCYSYHDNLIFLTDGEPSSLLPYVVLRDDEEYNHMHLWCMSPWKFESLNRRKEYQKLLGNFEKLTSIYYLNSDAYLKRRDKNKKLSDAMAECQEWLNSMLPGALYEIEKKLKRKGRYYFDDTIRRYVSIDQSYSELLNAEEIKSEEIDSFQPQIRRSTLGMLMCERYPNTKASTKHTVEKLYPRLDGKKVCEHMKKLRVQLARANDIPYEPVSCPSTGPCAGTCEQCDMELRYLQEMIQKKDEKERIYPKEESAYRPDEKPFPKPKAEEEHLMGFLRATKPIRTGQVSVEIPEFLKKRRGNRGEGEHHE